MPYNHGSRKNLIKARLLNFTRSGGKQVKLQVSETAAAFLVNTDKVTYLAFLYLDKYRQYQSSGHVIFADGEKWHFSMDGRHEPRVREKCLSMARRIANIYEGALKQGIVDDFGRFWPLDGKND